jgi:hypothetical protein
MDCFACYARAEWRAEWRVGEWRDVCQSHYNELEESRTAARNERLMDLPPQLRELLRAGK